MPNPSKDALKPEAEALVDRLAAEHPKEFMEALRGVLDERYAIGRGRPRGTGTDDSQRLHRMAELARSDEHLEDDRLAEIVAHEDPAESESATLKRLKRKWPEHKRQLEASTRSAEKRAALERVFAEEIETWDL